MEALRRSRPAGRVRILGADETTFKVKGREVLVGFVVDARSGKTLGFEVLFEGDGRAFKEWLEPYVERFGAEVLVSDDNDSYAVAASELGLSHQLCIAHVRKFVERRSKSILEQAEREWGELMRVAEGEIVVPSFGEAATAASELHHSNKDGISVDNEHE